MSLKKSSLSLYLPIASYPFIIYGNISSPEYITIGTYLACLFVFPPLEGKLHEDKYHMSYSPPHPQYSTVSDSYHE